MIITSRYAVKRDKGAAAFRVCNIDTPLCPSCGSLCSGYDTRLRRVIGDDGRTVAYRLRRVRCTVCNALHIEMPDFMRPRKHYTAAVINAAIGGRGEGCPAEASTMWRWRRENYPPGLQ